MAVVKKIMGPPGTGKTYHAKEIAKKFTLEQSNRDFEHILPAELKQPSLVELEQMSDDEYRDFIINAIKTASDALANEISVSVISPMSE